MTANQSSVLLVDDIDSSIAVKVDRSNVDAIVQGQAQHGGRLLVRRIAQGADVARGDLIKTSGTGGTLPKGLLVGQIYEIHQKDIDQDQEALAFPLADSGNRRPGAGDRRGRGARRPAAHARARGHADRLRDPRAGAADAALSRALDGHAGADPHADPDDDAAADAHADAHPGEEALIC